LTGEVNIIDGMNEQIAVSRDKFNFNPDFEKLKDFLRDKLKKYANELDAVQSVENKGKEINTHNKILSLKDLDVKNLSEELEHLEKKGYTVRKKNSSNSDDNSSKSLFSINKLTKEILIRDDFEDFYKQLKINNTIYRLKIDKWDWEKSKLPAVERRNKFLYVNSNYPLFQEKKSTDTFLKLHILLYNYFENKIIGEKLYHHFLADLLTLYYNNDEN
jgi:hypothetical protein